MDFVDKEHITLVKVCQKSRQIARLFNGGSAGHSEINAHFVGNDARKRCFAEPRRAVKQNMVKRLASLTGGLDINRKIFLYLVLTDIFAEDFGAKRKLYVIILRRGKLGSDNSVFKIRINKYPPALKIFCKLFECLLYHFFG